MPENYSTKRNRAYWLTLYSPLGTKFRVQMTRDEMITVYDNMGKTLDSEVDCINGVPFGSGPRAFHGDARRV